MKREELIKIIPKETFIDYYTDKDLSYDEIVKRLSDDRITSNMLRHLNTDVYHCVKNKDKIKQRTEKTNIEKYGCKNPSQNNNVKEKMINNKKNLSEEDKNKIIEKIKATKKERYGDENYVNKEQIKKSLNNKSQDEWNDIHKKIRNTCIEKYGVEHYMKLPELKDKVKNTIREKYGVDYSFQLGEHRTIKKEKSIDPRTFQEKIKDTWRKKTKEEIDDILFRKAKTCQEKYGVEYPQQLLVIKEKMKQTNIDRYGGPAPIYDKTIKNKIFLNKSSKLNLIYDRDVEPDLMTNKDKLLAFILNIPENERTL